MISGLVFHHLYFSVHCSIAPHTLLVVDAKDIIDLCWSTNIPAPLILICGFMYGGMVTLCRRLTHGLWRCISIYNKKTIVVSCKGSSIIKTRHSGYRPIITGRTNPMCIYTEGKTSKLYMQKQQTNVCIFIREFILYPHPWMLPGVVSLTFRELSKIISRKYTMPEITVLVRI